MLTITLTKGGADSPSFNKAISDRAKTSVSPYNSEGKYALDYNHLAMNMRGYSPLEVHEHICTLQHFEKSFATKAVRDKYLKSGTTVKAKYAGTCAKRLASTLVVLYPTHFPAFAMQDYPHNPAAYIDCVKAANEAWKRIRKGVSNG